MKILFVAQRFHTNLKYRVQALQEAGNEVQMLVMYKQHSESYDTLEPKLVKRSVFDGFLKKVFKKNDFYKTRMQMPSFWHLGKLFKQEKPDILIIKNLQSFLSIFSLIWSALYGKDVYLLIQTDSHRVKGRIKKILVWVLKNIFTVKKVISPLKDKTGSNNPFFAYIPFVYDVKDLEKEHFKGGKINIIDIGKFQKRKDHITLLKAVSSLKDKYDILLRIVGEKMDQVVEDEIQRYISKNSLDNIVEVKVNQAYEEVLKMYKDFDLFVLPSYDEPAAYSIVEAMANGLPVIVSDTCGTKCYVESGVNGYVFKSKKVDSLIEEIEKIINDKHNCLVRMSKNSYQKSINDHSLKNFSDQFKKING